MFADIMKAADLGWLATDNNQQSYNTFANVWTRVSADGGHFEHVMWTRQSRL